MMFKNKTINTQTNVPEKKKRTVLKLLGSFCVAVALFGVLIGVEKNILSDYAKEKVVLCKTELPKGTKITESNLGQYFYTYEVDAALVDDKCVKDMNELIGTVAVRTLEAQEIVHNDDCTKEAEIYTRYQNPAEGSFSVNDAGDIVSGTIRCGDYVNIAVINKDTLEYDLILNEVYVVDAFTATGEKIGTESHGATATMLTIVEDEVNLARFYSAREIGTVIVTKIEQSK